MNGKTLIWGKVNKDKSTAYTDHFCFVCRRINGDLPEEQWRWEIHTLPRLSLEQPAILIGVANTTVDAKRDCVVRLREWLKNCLEDISEQ